MVPLIVYTHVLSSASIQRLQRRLNPSTKRYSKLLMSLQDFRHWASSEIATPSPLKESTISSTKKRLVQVTAHSAASSTVLGWRQTRWHGSGLVASPMDSAPVGSNTSCWEILPKNGISIPLRIRSRTEKTFRKNSRGIFLRTSWANCWRSTSLSCMIQLQNSAREGLAKS